MFSAADLRVLADHTDGGQALREMAEALGEDSRVRVGGFIHRVLAHHHVLIPTVGLSTAHAVELAAADAREDLLEGLLSNHPDREWAAQFSVDKCVVPLEGRPGQFVVDARIPGLTSLPIVEYDGEVVPEDATVFTEKRQYSLDQFFSDMDVVEKFPLSEQYLQTVRRCAVTKPQAAAEMLQGFLRSKGYTGLVVKAGKYVKSRKRAAEAIKEATRKLLDKDFGVWSRTVDQKIFYYHEGSDDVLRWSVEGPLRYAFEVKCVYDLCLNVGVNEAVQMLALETTIIGIDVYDALECKYVTGVVEAHMSLVGIQPSDERVVPGLSSEDTAHFLAATDKVLPVVVDERVVATAVKVTDRYSLVCNHVVADIPEGSEMLVAGATVLQHKTVGNDLWVVSGSGVIQTAWNLRDARVGEKVVLVYSVGTKLEVTSPVQITNVDGSDIAMVVPPQLRKGMSGAAVVAVSDRSFLGVYRGKTGNRALATVFGPQKYGDLVDVEMSSHASVLEQHDADDVHARYERRGYSAAFKAACDAVVPLHSETKHVGFGLCYGKDLVTPLDPDVYALRMHGDKGRAPEFNSTFDGRFFTPVDPAEARQVYVQGKPHVGMRVVVCGKDSAGVYISEVCVVNQIGVGAKRFYVDPPEYSPGMPLVGGVVLSYDNATVVGQYVGKQGESVGTKGVCVSTYERPRSVTVEEPPASATTVLAEKFPMLSPVAWEVGTLDKMLNHPKGNSLLAARAMIGDSVMKIVAFRALEKMGARVSTWTITKDEWQRNEYLTRVSADLGLNDLFVIESGLSIPAGSKRYADLVEALVGMAFLHEEWSVVEQFCRALRVIPEEDAGTTPTVGGFPRLQFGSVGDPWTMRSMPEGSSSSG